MTVSITQTLLELWQTWGHDHFTGEPVPVADTPLREKPFPNVTYEPPWASFYFFGFLLLVTGKGDQHLLCHCPPWGLQWGHSQPPLPLAKQTKRPQQLFESLALEAVHHLDGPALHITIPWCPSSTEAPKTAHNAWGWASACRVGQSPPQPASNAVLDAPWDAVMSYFIES